MTESTTTAASPAPTGAPGQAATSVSQGTPPADQPTAQSGPSATSTGTTDATTGPQGDQPGSTQQPETPAAPVVPERYELRLPEGTALDTSDVERVTALAKTHQWSNEQAQVTLDEMASSLSAQSAAFRAELTADPELGGANLEQVQQRALAVMDRFLPASHPDGALLRSTLNKTGYGNWKPLIRLLAGIGQAMSEDRPHAGTSTSGARPVRSQAERMFGDAQGVKPPS